MCGNCFSALPTLPHTSALPLRAMALMMPPESTTSVLVMMGDAMLGLAPQPLPLRLDLWCWAGMASRSKACTAGRDGEPLTPAAMVHTQACMGSIQINSHSASAHGLKRLGSPPSGSAVGLSGTPKRGPRTLQAASLHSRCTSSRHETRCRRAPWTRGG